MIPIQITGYHTCKDKGGRQYVKANGPFISNNGKKQWLTQGFYFWADSEHFAHKWGEQSCNNKYFILKCDIEMPKDLLLDLVGSAQSQQYFMDMLSVFNERLKKIGSHTQPTVHAVISYWRQLSAQDSTIFPFLAIKAEDDRNMQKLSFVEGRNERMLVGIHRQQLCLFAAGKNCLVNKEIVYP